MLGIGHCCSKIEKSQAKEQTLQANAYGVSIRAHTIYIFFSISAGVEILKISQKLSIKPEILYSTMRVKTKQVEMNKTKD